MDTTLKNDFEGIEYNCFSRRFAAYTNKWPPFAQRNLIGTYASLCQAVDARNRYVEFHENTRTRPHKEFATYVDPNLETRPY